MAKKILIGIVVVSALLGAGLAYLYNRATAKPQWYTTAPIPDTSVPASELLAQRIRQTNGQVQVLLSEDDLNRMAASAAAESAAIAPIVSASNGIITHIEDGKIESGTVVNLSELPTATLPAPGQQAVSQLQQRFPLLANRDIYIGVSGQPRVEGGQLRLGEGAALRVGRVSVPLSQAAEQIGLSQAELEAQIAALLVRQGITLEAVQAADGQLLLTGQ